MSDPGDFVKRVATALDRLATTPLRRELAAEGIGALRHLSGEGLVHGLVTIEIFGSFVSSTAEPSDVDLLLRYDEADPEVLSRVSALYGSHLLGPVTIVAVDAGREGDVFADEFRAETARSYGVDTVRVHREP